MKNIIYILVSSVFVALFVSLGPSTSGVLAQAQGKSCDDNVRFLTAPAWYRGVVDDNCNIVINKTTNENLGGGVGEFLLKVGMNIVEIMMHLVAYTSVAFIIVGGFKYMTSAGSQDGSVKARKTIINAVIGLVLSMVAIGVITFVIGRITK